MLGICVCVQKQYWLLAREFPAHMLLFSVAENSYIFPHYFSQNTCAHTHTHRHTYICSHTPHEHPLEYTYLSNFYWLKRKMFLQGQLRLVSGAGDEGITPSCFSILCFSETGCNNIMIWKQDIFSLILIVKYVSYVINLFFSREHSPIDNNLSNKSYFPFVSQVKLETHIPPSISYWIEFHGLYAMLTLHVVLIFQSNHIFNPLIILMLP